MRNVRIQRIPTLALLPVALVAFASGTAAQPARVALSGDDLRAAYANSADVAEGKRVAESSCASCHGADGVSAAKAVPHLAGQRAAYLARELRAYRSGARSNDAMTGAVRFMSDDALAKVAAYYASLDPAPPAAAEATKAMVPTPDAVQAGKAAAAACGGCHGEAGVSRMPGMPSLVGLDPKYLVFAMKAYKNGQRKHEMMASVLARATEADMANMALFYAMQKAVRTENPAPGDIPAGKAAAAGCASCHGDNGISANASVPSLAGQDAQYFIAVVRAYRDGARRDEPMKGLVAPLEDTTVKHMAAFYAAQQPQQAKVMKPLAAAEWAQRCDRCHGVGGNSADPRVPALAGQRVDYLQKVLHAYRTGARKSPEMAAMSEALGEADVDGLAAHYARQKPRAVVYVLLPAR